MFDRDLVTHFPSRRGTVTPRPQVDPSRTGFAPIPVTGPPSSLNPSVGRILLAGALVLLCAVLVIVCVASLTVALAFLIIGG